MKVAITGSEGMLARDLIDVLAPVYELLLIDKVESCADRGHEYACMDLGDEEKVGPAIGNAGLSLVFHCAAFTNVDGAEEHVEEAYKCNALATGRLAWACRNASVPLVAISTDYVFDGAKKGSYCEFDAVNPQSVYGKSKLWGEQLAFQSGARVAIVRTSWLFGVGGNNFVKTIKRLCAEKDRVSVVDDQRGSPTFTADLAACLAVLGKGMIGGRPYEGIWHVTNSGVCTWFEFAQSIVELTGSKTTIEPTTTESLARPAPRPANSALQNLRWSLEGLPPRRHWREALEDYLAREGRADRLV
jgi:dTDP-4-dehydrorhamnose reductase